MRLPYRHRHRPAMHYLKTWADVQMELRDLHVNGELTNANTSGGIGISGTFTNPFSKGIST